MLLGLTLVLLDCVHSVFCQNTPTKVPGLASESELLLRPWKHEGACIQVYSDMNLSRSNEYQNISHRSWVKFRPLLQSPH